MLEEDTASKDRVNYMIFLRYLPVEQLCSIIFVLCFQLIVGSSRYPDFFWVQPSFILQFNFDQVGLERIIELFQLVSKQILHRFNQGTILHFCKFDLTSVLSTFNNNRFGFSLISFSRFASNTMSYDLTLNGPDMMVSLIQSFAMELGPSCEYSPNELLHLLIDAYYNSIKQVCEVPSSYNLTGLEPYNPCQWYYTFRKGFPVVILALAILIPEVIRAIVGLIQCGLTYFDKYPIAEVAFIKKVLLGFQHALLLTWFHLWRRVQIPLRSFLKENSLGTIHNNRFPFVLLAAVTMASTITVFHSESCILNVFQRQGYHISSKSRSIQSWGSYAFIICTLIPYIILVNVL